MVFKRSDVRLLCYRKKANIEITKQSLLDILPHLEASLLEGDTWQTFATEWDVVVKPDEIIRVSVERDEVFVNDFCISMRTQTNLGISLEEITNTFSTREWNVYNVVLVNYLGDTVDWSEYKISWTVEVDTEYNRLEVRNLKTEKAPVTSPKSEIKVEDNDDVLMEKIKALLKKSKG